MSIIKKYSQIILTSGLGAFLITGLSGCSSNNQEQNYQEQKAKGAFVIIEEVEKGKYKIKDKNILDCRQNPVQISKRLRSDNESKKD